jgi:hypothetical protein
VGLTCENAIASTVDNAGIAIYRSCGGF